MRRRCEPERPAPLTARELAERLTPAQRRWLAGYLEGRIAGERARRMTGGKL